MKNTMKANDLFDKYKIQVFDKLTGNWICTITMHDNTGDLRQVEDYQPIIETKEIENKNQLQLF